MSDRVKGQEVSILFTGPEGEIELAARQSFEATVLLDTLSEGYLGETTERKDDVYRGIEGRLSIHLETDAYLTLIQTAKERSQRQRAGVFNLSAVMSFPNGDIRRVFIEDVKFGNFPLNVGGRDEYVTGEINFAADDYRTLTS
jgi:hypothetical protein